MKYIITILITSFFLPCLGQKETLTFKLSKPKDLIEIATADSVFHLGEKNLFTVTSKGTDKITKVEVYNGKLHSSLPGFYDVIFKKSGPTFIKVLVENVKGESSIGLIQKINVMGLPEVNLYVCGSPRDSALNLHHLVENRTLTAKMKNPKAFDYKPIVMSFTMILESDTLKINGNQIPFQYKKKLYNFEEGDVLEILEARIMLPTSNKNIVIAPYYSVFLVNTDQYSVGKRTTPIDGINPSGD